LPKGVTINGIVILTERSESPPAAGKTTGTK
jgi:hypothetical protein